MQGYPTYSGGWSPLAHPSVPAYLPVGPGAGSQQYLARFAQESCDGSQDLNMLRDDLAGELQAINQYWLHAQKASDPQVKALLCHIMNDEKEHYAEVTALIRELDPSQNADFQQIERGEH